MLVADIRSSSTDL